MDRLLLAALGVWTLSALAIAQPIYDITGSAAEFYVVRGSTPIDLVLLVVTLSVTVPILLIGALALLRRWNARLGRAFQLLLVAGLVTIYVSRTLRILDVLDGAAALLVTAALGLVFTTAYARLPVLPLFLAWLSPVVLLFPLLFLLATPVRGIALPGEESAWREGRAELARTPPIVLVVMDEFPLVSLLDGQGGLDAVQYPNLGRFARTATWYRRATTVAVATSSALPAILTGVHPRERLLPNVQDHPQNLFTWLAGRYDFNVWEVASYLCPDALSGRNLYTPSDSERRRVLASDLGIVLLHAVLPFRYTTALPLVDNQWGNFLGEASNLGVVPDRAEIGAVRDALLQGDRVAFFREFVSGIEGGDERASLHFIHLMLPHTPWEYLPSGRKYVLQHRVEGVTTQKDRFLGLQSLVSRYHHRHLLQAAFTDRLLGEMLDRLESEGLFDDALIVLMADHGVRFASGDLKRHLSKTNAAELLFIPLLVKLPGQREGAVSDAPVESVDVVPTIAAALGSELPWAATGTPLQHPERAPPESLEAMDYNGSMHSFRYSDLLAQLDRAQQRNRALFGQDLFRRGPRVDLLDQPLGRFQIIDAPTELELDQAALLQEVDLDGPFVPAEITGRLGLRPARGGAAERTVLIAANGVIRAVARVHEVGGDMRFSGILPESSFRNGANEVEVYAAEAGGILLHLGGTDRARGRFVRDGDRALVDAEGRRYAIVEPRDLRGRVQKIQSAGGRITFEGWAADFGTGEPADRVIAFDGGEQIYSGRTNAVRENVARRLERPEDRLFGYRFVLARSAVEQLAAVPALFALSEHAGIAVPLPYEESARAALTALLDPRS